MKRRALFIVSQDPRSSARTAEGIRIAAGVGTWKRVEIQLYLRDAAVLALSEYPDDLIDEDNFTRYLPIVAECAGSILVQQGAPLLQEIGVAPLPYREISDEELARVAAESHFVLRF